MPKVIGEKKSRVHNQVQKQGKHHLTEQKIFRASDNH